MATVAHGKLGGMRGASDVCSHSARTLAIALDAAADCAGVPMSISERTKELSALKSRGSIRFRGVGFAAHT